MKKRLVTFLLACLAVGTLAGCGAEETVAESSSQAAVESTASAESSQSTETPVKEENSKEIYEAFLAGTGKVYTEKFDGYRYDFDGSEVKYYAANDGYTLDEFLAVTLVNESTFTGKQQIGEVAYQLIDCGADGEPELLLKVWLTEDDYYPAERQYVMKAMDGKLQLTYQNESDPYTQEEVVSDTGAIASNSMYSYDYWYEGAAYLDANGQYRQVYNVLVNMFAPASYILDARFSEAVNENAEELQEVYVRVYRIGEAPEDEDDPTDSTLYYCGEKTEDEPSNGYDFKENVRLLQEVFDKSGEKLYSMQEIQSMIADREKAIGVTDVVKQGKELNLTDLKLKDAWTKPVINENLGGGGGTPEVYLPYAVDFEYKPGNYPDLDKQADQDTTVIDEIEANLDKRGGSEYDDDLYVYGPGTTQVLKKVPDFDWQVVSTYVDTGNPLLDSVMKSAGYDDYSVIYEYNFGLYEPYYSGLNTPVRALLYIGDAYYEYVFWDKQLLLRRTNDGVSYNPKVNDFINSLYKVGWYYGEYLNGTLDSDMTELSIFAPDSQIHDDGEVIFFSDDVEMTEVSNVYAMDEDTVFGDYAALEFFEGYQAGDTPLTWVRRMLGQLEEYPTALAGVYDISVSEGHIDSLNGIYWWD